MVLVGCPVVGVVWLGFFLRGFFGWRGAVAWWFVGGWGLISGSWACALPLDLGHWVWLRSGWRRSGLVGFVGGWGWVAAPGVVASGVVVGEAFVDLLVGGLFVGPVGGVLHGFVLGGGVDRLGQRVVRAGAGGVYGLGLPGFLQCVV